MIIKRKCIAAISLLTGFLYTAQAMDMDFGGVDIHGAVSQGYLKTTTNTYLQKDSQKGSFEFAEIVLNASKDVSDKLRIGAQLISRDFGEEGNFSTELDWGYGDYRFREWLGIRAGKVKLPQGWHNEYRDIDASRTAIFLDQGFYPEGNRAISNAYEGIGLYGSFLTEKTGEFEYHVYAGTVNVPDNYYNNDRIWEGLSSDEAKLEINYMWGGQIIYNPPLEGLRFNYSHLRMSAAMDLTLTNPTTFVKTSYADAYQYYFQLNSVGLEYMFRKFTLTAEYETFQGDAEVSPAYQTAASGIVLAVIPFVGNITFYDTVVAFATAGPSSDVSAWYVNLDHQCTEKFSVGLAYGELEHKNSSGAFTSYNNDLTISTRYDFDFHWRAKLEYHHIRGLSGVRSELPNSNYANDNEDWGLFAARVSFSF